MGKHTNNMVKIHNRGELGLIMREFGEGEEDGGSELAGYKLKQQEVAECRNGKTGDETAME